MLLHLPRMEGYRAGETVKNGPPLAGHGAEAVREAIVRSMAKLPDTLRQSLTWDQSAEMAQHARLRIDTGLHVYFCDPQSPWQRGNVATWQRGNVATWQRGNVARTKIPMACCVNTFLKALI